MGPCGVFELVGACGKACGAEEAGVVEIGFGGGAGVGEGGLVGAAKFVGLAGEAAGFASHDL